MLVRFHLLDTGYCTASASHMLRGAPHRTVECHALVALIEHPRHGWLLWDAGYAPRLHAALRPWPLLLYLMATPLYLEPQLAVVAQLSRFGLRPADIGHIIISHFHTDHIAGLRDFPAAEIVAAADALDSIIGLDGFAALRRAFAPALLPPDFAARMRPIFHFDGPPLDPFGPTHDLFGDGALQLVQLPGHARGQLGLFLHSEQGPFLLAADGAWLNQAIREQRGPGLPGYLIADDRRALDATLAKLHTFAKNNPTVTIVPTHCPEVYARVQRGAL